MSTFSPCEYPILFQKAWRITGFAKDLAALNRNDLHDEYEKLVRSAPRRSDKKKAYFVEHADRESAKTSNRGEEILAKALWNLKLLWPHPGGGRFCLLDYQFPLKAQRSDKGIGKVDLLGVTVQGRLMVIELKVKTAKGTPGETPMKALMEGLRYAAIVKANREAIAQEAKVCFNMEIAAEPPLVQILAQKSWWEAWMNLGGSARKAAGRWEPEFAKLLTDIRNILCVDVECLALDGLNDCDITLGIRPDDTETRRPPSLSPIPLTADQILFPVQVAGTDLENYGNYIEYGAYKAIYESEEATFRNYVEYEEYEAMPESEEESVWSYRVIRKHGSEINPVTYQVHEVYFREDGSIWAWTKKPDVPAGDTAEELREDIRYFLQAFRGPILEERETDEGIILVPDDVDQVTNDDHYFELVDRAFIALERIYRVLGTQAFFKKDKMLKNICEKAEEALTELHLEASGIERGSS